MSVHIFKLRTRLPSNVRDEILIRVMKERGIVYPKTTLIASRHQGLSLSAACASLILETSGGHNEFGSDPGNPVHGGTVTHERYLMLRAYIREGYPSQGVGPCQLTSVFLLNDADKIGGAWNVAPNMMIGFRFLQQLIRQYGTFGGFRHYNGSGPAAVRYAIRAIMLRNNFHRAFVRAGVA